MYYFLFERLVGEVGKMGHTSFDLDSQIRKTEEGGNRGPFLPYQFGGKRLALLPSVLYHQAMKVRPRIITHISSLLEIISRGIYDRKIILLVPYT